MTTENRQTIDGFKIVKKDRIEITNDWGTARVEFVKVELVPVDKISTPLDNKDNERYNSYIPYLHKGEPFYEITGFWVRGRDRDRIGLDAVKKFMNIALPYLVMVKPQSEMDTSISESYFGNEHICEYNYRTNLSFWKSIGFKLDPEYGV